MTLAQNKRYFQMSVPLLIGAVFLMTGAARLGQEPFALWLIFMIFGGVAGLAGVVLLMMFGVYPRLATWMHNKAPSRSLRQAHDELTLSYFLIEERVRRRSE